MNTDIKKRLEENGWTVNAVRDFLGLTDEETRFFEWRVSLGKVLIDKRKSKGYSQTLLDREIGSSQAMVAKMEAEISVSQLT